MKWERMYCDSGSQGSILANQGQSSAFRVAAEVSHFAETLRHLGAIISTALIREILCAKVSTYSLISTRIALIA